MSGLDKIRDRNAALPELLAPAGDPTRLEAALQYGANAVYLAGKRYGMRAAPDNFSEPELEEAVKAAHRQGVKVYVTCNTLPRDGELEGLPEFLSFCDSCGVDAIIAADLGVMSLVKRYAPSCALHASTQTGVVNHETARCLYEQGVSRVVLARELSLEEIATLRAKAPAGLELECFVHGAMCVSFSGRCLLSAYLNGRDANRGDCTQPCRWRYELTEQSRRDLPFFAEESGEGTYLFNANDLCMIEHVAALAQAGISSFKIEGRAKTAYYTAVVTNAYRLALDAYRDSGFDPAYRPAGWLTEELDTVSHRPYGTGFYFGTPAQETRKGGYVRHYEVAAVVDRWENGRLWLYERNRFREGDTMRVLEPKKPPHTLTLRGLYSEQGEPLTVVSRAEQHVYTLCDRPLAPGSFLRRPIKEEET